MLIDSIRGLKSSLRTIDGYMNGEVFMIQTIIKSITFEDFLECIQMEKDVSSYAME